MGCVSSAFLEERAEDEQEQEQEQERRRIISHHHIHIVSLTSSTYGILTAPRAYSSSSPSEASSSSSSTTTPLSPAPPPPPPPPPPPSAISSTRTRTTTQTQEVINSWELMAGLVDPATPAKPTRRRTLCCPPGAVLYTTSLRGVRRTFDACNAVRAALQAHGVAFRERDVSMDRGFRDELRELLLCLCGGGEGKARAAAAAALPRLFVRGRHVGGPEEVLRLEEQGLLAPLLEGLPRARGGTCDGCGGMRFLPCFDCSGSRKVALALDLKLRAAGNVRLRCGECNENGLVLCPICC